MVVGAPTCSFSNTAIVGTSTAIVSRSYDQSHSKYAIVSTSYD